MIYRSWDAIVVAEHYGIASSADDAHWDLMQDRLNVRSLVLQIRDVWLYTQRGNLCNVREPEIWVYSQTSLIRPYWFLDNFRRIRK